MEKNNISSNPVPEIEGDSNIIKNYQSDDESQREQMMMKMKTVIIKAIYLMAHQKIN